MQIKSLEEEREKEHALVSLFAIHQTKDPENIIRESMGNVLSTYTERVREAAKEEERERVLAALQGKEISPGVTNGKSQFTASDVYQALSSPTTKE